MPRLTFNEAYKRLRNRARKFNYESIARETLRQISTNLSLRIRGTPAAATAGTSLRMPGLSSCKLRIYWDFYETRCLP